MWITAGSTAEIEARYDVVTFDLPPAWMTSEILGGLPRRDSDQPDADLSQIRRRASTDR